ncbi:kinase-like protein [Aureobasidium pullulans]|uniref:Kinase-like protein n=1 Tax=Aureobasidium pullulans TaxID=5580 RepID=A0A4T0BMX4_AURPU|nr:kinase-like protein [Aureobasidium pullulans]
MSLTFAESETTSLPLVDFDDTTPGDDPVIGTVGEAIEASKTRARSGKYLSSLSELVTLLAELGANVCAILVCEITGTYADDYPDRKTPIPVLVMEAALFPLSEMLEDSQRHLDTLIAVSHWDVRHHIALDVAAGVEALHSSEIIHGDIKPANVLIFRQDNPSVPFLAKLSDFGVCIDMSDHKIGARDYFGTSKCPKP